MTKKTRKQKRKAERKRADPRRQRKLTKVEAKLQTTERRRRRTKHVDVAALKTKLTTPTELPTKAAKIKHPERHPSKAELVQRGTYAVFIDRERRTCIRVDAGRELTYYIPMDSAGIDVQSMRHDQFDVRFKPYAYPLIRAARLYAESAQSFGYTEKARQHLEDILNGSTSAKEQTMATKKQMKKGSKSKKIAGVFDPKRMIVKGNKEALKKARSARMSGATPKYADRTIRKLVKSAEAAGLRKGSTRAKMLDFVLKHSKTNDVLGKKIDGKEIRGDNLAGMVSRKHIQIL